MKTIISLFFILTIFVSCNRTENKKDNLSKSLNKTYPLHEPIVKTKIDLDEVKDTIPVPMEIIWDNKTESEKGSLHKPETREEIINEIMTIQPGIDSTLLILDCRKNRIIKLSQSGKWLGSFGGLGSGPGESIEPRWMVSYNDRIYLADQRNGRMQILDQNGKFIRQISFRTADMKYRFAIGRNGEIISRTIPGDTSLIVLYDSLGNVIRKFGNYMDEYGYNLAQKALYNDMLIEVDTLKGFIWCLFEHLPFIRRYDFNGNYLEEIKLEGKERMKYLFAALKENDKKNKANSSYPSLSGPLFIMNSNICNNDFYFNILTQERGYYNIKIESGGSVIRRVYFPKFSSKLENSYFLGTSFYQYSRLFCWTYNWSIMRSKQFN